MLSRFTPDCLHARNLAASTSCGLASNVTSASGSNTNRFRIPSKTVPICSGVSIEGVPPPKYTVPTRSEPK